MLHLYIQVLANAKNEKQTRNNANRIKNMTNHYRKHDLKIKARQPCWNNENAFGFPKFIFSICFFLRACIFSVFLWFTVHAHFSPACGHSTIQSLQTIPNSFLITLLVTAIPTPWHSYMDNREYHNHATKLLPIAKFIAAQLFWRTISFKTLHLHVCTFLFRISILRRTRLPNNSANHIVWLF